MTLETLASLGESLAIVITLGIAVCQIFKERKIRSFQLYRALADNYSNLLWKSKEDNDLDKIWEPFEKKLQLEIDSAHKNCGEHRWPVWKIMSPEERKCYRLTRSGLEIFEQAFLGNECKFTDTEVWEKWKSWMIDWENSNPFTKYVLEENKDWFVISFRNFLEKEIKSH